MLTWNPHLFPPGGFVMIDAEGIEHRGNNLEQLATRLAEYRIRRELPIGNPVAEVHDYMCAKFPSRCRQSDPPSDDVLAQTRANDLTSSVGLWLRELWRRLSIRQVKWARDEKVKERVAICLACPKHSKATSDCAVCQESLNQVSFQLRAGRDRQSHVLAVCTHYRRDARVDVLLDEPPDASAPANCWKKPTGSDLCD